MGTLEGFHETLHTKTITICRWQDLALPVLEDWQILVPLLKSSVESVRYKGNSMICALHVQRYAVKK